MTKTQWLLIAVLTLVMIALLVACVGYGGVSVGIPFGGGGAYVQPSVGFGFPL